MVLGMPSPTVICGKPKLVWRFYNSPTVRKKRNALWLKVAELLGLKVKPYKKRESKKKRI